MRLRRVVLSVVLVLLAFVNCVHVHVVAADAISASSSSCVKESDRTFSLVHPFHDDTDIVAAEPISTSSNNDENKKLLYVNPNDETRTLRALTGDHCKDPADLTGTDFVTAGKDGEWMYRNQSWCWKLNFWGGEAIIQLVPPDACLPPPALPFRERFGALVRDVLWYTSILVLWVCYECVRPRHSFLGRLIVRHGHR